MERCVSKNKTTAAPLRNDAQGVRGDCVWLKLGGRLWVAARESGRRDVARWAGFGRAEGGGDEAGLTGGGEYYSRWGAGAATLVSCQGNKQSAVKVQHGRPK